MIALAAVFDVFFLMLHHKCVDFIFPGVTSGDNGLIWLLKVPGMPGPLGDTIQVTEVMEIPITASLINGRPAFIT